MQHYRSVHASSIWSEPSLGSFSDDRRFVYGYLLTHPELTSLGTLCTTLVDLAARFDWPFERFQTAFNGCIEQNLVLHDEAHSLLWLVEFFNHDILQSPQQVMEWQVDEEALPDCPLKEKIMARALIEARQVLAFYFNDRPFETDERIPLFVRAWLLALKAHSQTTEENSDGALS